MRIRCAAALAVSLLWPLPVWAQSPAGSEAGHPKAAATAPASVQHVLAKTVTINAAAGAVFMTIFGVGTGSLPAATVLTAGSLAASTVIYPVNEYVWDYLSPNTNLSANNRTFDKSASLWRTTYKYVSFKVSVLTSEFAWVYLYTGSVAATLTMGTASSLALPAVFYLNNTAWDWYDWSTAAPVAEQMTRAASR